MMDYENEKLVVEIQSCIHLSCSRTSNALGRSACSIRVQCAHRLVYGSGT